MPTRTVTVMGVIQILVICFSYFLSSAFLKLWEKGYGAASLEWLSSTPSYRWLAFIRGFIFLLLLVPVAMCVICGKLTQAHRDIAILGRDGFWIAIVVTLAAIICAVCTIGVALSPPPLPRWS